MSGLMWDGTVDPSRDTKFSGANGGREKNIFSFQLITSRIGSHAPVDRSILC